MVETAAPVEGNGSSGMLLRPVDAIRRIGCSKSTLRRLVADGLVEAIEHDGKTFYDEEAVEDARAALNGAPQTGPSDRWVEQVLKHQREIMTLALTGQRQIVEALTTEVRELRGERLEYYRATQAALNEADERRLAAVDVAARIDARTTGLSYLERIASAIVVQVQASGQVSRLVRGLSAEQFAMLGQLLTAEQRAAIESLRASAQEPAQPEQPKEQEDG